VKGYGKAVREALRQAGCEFVRHGKGDHDLWRNRAGKSFAVPVKIMSRHVANEILKQAGLPKQF
jgi:predicted RNA binding protein YcfA (HicA-like mRNA interferase family)